MLGARSLRRAPLSPAFLCLVLALLVQEVASKTSLRELRESRHRHAGSIAPAPGTNVSILGRKELVNTTFGAPNTTLPFTLAELGLENNHRRSLLLSVTDKTTGTVCRIHRNYTLTGGELSKGPKQIKQIATAGACCARCAFIEGCEAWSWSRQTRTCFPRGAEGWKLVKSDKHIAGFIKRESPPPPPPRSAVAMGYRSPPAVRPTARSPPGRVTPSGNLIWQGKLNIGDNQLRTGFAGEVKTVNKANNKVVITDPTGASNDPVIKAMYNKGCWSPEQECGGGALFYAWPESRLKHIGDAARLEYEVYFPENFTFIKGGKLPGFLGGDSGCGGGVDAAERGCWSVRLMWRTDGHGEAYIYADRNAQASDFCTTPGTVCDPDAGISFMRGAFTFKRGAWNKIALTVKMNDVGKKNGYIQLDHDGDTKILYEKVVYRTPSSPNLHIDGLVFATWFGGSDETWAPKAKQETYFKNFKIYKLD